MDRTHLSLFYLPGYLLLGGVTVGFVATLSAHLADRGAGVAVQAASLAKHSYEDR
jgi:hypothetical protein